MPAPALPQPLPQNTGLVRLTRVYRDLAQRPLKGRITITGSTASSQVGTEVTSHAPTVVELVDGVLDVRLPPGVYTLSAQLANSNDAVSAHEEEVTL